MITERSIERQVLFGCDDRHWRVAELDGYRFIKIVGQQKGTMISFRAFLTLVHTDRTASALQLGDANLSLRFERSTDRVGAYGR